ncbi:hypothetical protein A1O1_05921 [Capronia coronata CBS 617.96]|uniref:Uncharacterized protein n=1 Tax=Capronia coronata CBS 617.96 TaxID=1182541 RepID=W9XYE3_9EURO|nr:uncharacterized protein A1O1_05921 [Capronia coronata CBS 617.96]EXJ85557.1 hypothetical protein A1O1_05921 [Capronia coronata CBS 617.96]
MSSSPAPDSFWVVAAPSRNWDDIPTINVCNHEVPLPAYWKIFELLGQGQAKREVIQSVIRHSGFKTLQVVTEVVESVAQNQQLISRRSTMSNRLSIPFKKANRISIYKALKNETHWEVPIVEDTLSAAKQRERRLLNDALAIAQQKEQLNGKAMNPDERRNTASAINDEMKQVLRQHQEAESEINMAKRLTAAQKASFT